MLLVFFSRAYDVFGYGRKNKLEVRNRFILSRKHDVRSPRTAL